MAVLEHPLDASHVLQNKKMSIGIEIMIFPKVSHLSITFVLNKFEFNFSKNVGTDFILKNMKTY